MKLHFSFIESELNIDTPPWIYYLTFLPFLHYYPHLFFCLPSLHLARIQKHVFKAFETPNCERWKERKADLIKRKITRHWSVWWMMVELREARETGQGGDEVEKARWMNTKCLKISSHEQVRNVGMFCYGAEGSLQIKWKPDLPLCLPQLNY